MPEFALDDPYSIVPDRYRPGRALDARGLFQLLCEELFRDGAPLSAEHDRLLLGVARKLDLPAGTTVRIARRAWARQRLGELGPPAPPDLRRFYERALYYVWADGEEDPVEAEMVRLLRRLLRVDDLEHHAYVSRVRRPGYVDRFGPGAPARPGAAHSRASTG
jgi:hypothetical protein